MSTQTKATLKGYFETGNSPTETNYAEFIDSQLNLKESNSTVQTASGSIQFTAPFTASGMVTASAILSAGNISGSSVSTGSFGRLKLDSYLTQTGPHQLVSNPQTVSVNGDASLDVDTHHARYVLATGTNAVITLPEVALGASFTIINDNADATQISVSPDADDKFLYNASGLEGADNKDIINTAATATKGDFVRLLGLTADGWAITELNGVWTDES